MKITCFTRRLALLLLAAGFVPAVSGGDRHYHPRYVMPPLGSISDEIWQRQEHNAEASDFVVYQHEFKLNGIRLNWAGEDHVKQIAMRLQSGQDFPVVIERSVTTAREDTTYKYPVHPNPELDLRRREVIVQALLAMGVTDADERVVVAPAFAQGFKATEAAATYLRGIMGGAGGGGGGFGGGGGGGGFGGGGGGFF